MVTLFAFLADLLKPKSFAGLFGAAPSVALATLGLTIYTDGKSYAALEELTGHAEAILKKLELPYRVVTPHEYPSLPAAVLLESVEIVAYKVPDGPDGPAVFTGRTAIYAGSEESFDDGAGHFLQRGIPVLCEKPVSTGLETARQTDWDTKVRELLASKYGTFNPDHNAPHGAPMPAESWFVTPGLVRPEK